MTEAHDDKEHEHTRMCIGHDKHWQDDFAYTDEKRLPIPENSPTLQTVAELVQEMAKDHDNPIVYRFALVYVDAKTGNLQVATNPSMSAAGCINILTRAASTLAFQQAMEDREIHDMLRNGLGQMFANAPKNENDGDRPGQYL